MDAFSLPNRDEMVNEISKCRVFSTIDLRSAYHQVPLKDEDKPYAAFEACGGLDQIPRLPFGVTNGVACFQENWITWLSKMDLKKIPLPRHYNHMW